MARRPAGDHADPARLGELLVMAWRTFSRRGQARFSEHGLAAARVRALTTLAASGRVRMVDLAKALGVTNRAVTPIVDALAADGLVERQPDPADRRAFQLVLTPAGAAQVKTISRLQRTISEEIFSVLTPDERDQLGRLLAKFVGEQASCPDDPSSPDT